MLYSCCSGQGRNQSYGEVLRLGNNYTATVEPFLSCHLSYRHLYYPNTILVSSLDGRGRHLACTYSKVAR